MQHFTGEGACLPCIWRQNCTDEFVSIDARGHVAQCDCWVTSYPDYWFGNIFDDISFTDLMQQSKARQQFQARPEVLMRKRELCRVRLPVALPWRVSGADIYDYGRILRQGPVLPGLQGPLLHHGRAGSKDGRSQVLARFCQ